LFIVLIALIAIMLTAASLTRSVDTNTMIAGNLAFKQSATASADSGLERAITWLHETDDANHGKDPFVDADHSFNHNNVSVGYYSFVDPNLDLFADATWAASAGTCAAPDGAGNTVCYIIQRMCRTAEQVLSEADCLFSDGEINTSSMRVKSATEAGAKTTGNGEPMLRVTVRVVGPRNTSSYVQAFVY